MAGLGALRKLDLDHLDLRIARSRLEALGAKRAVLVAAPEVAAAELPDDVAAELAVIFAEATFAGIVREAAELRPLVERADRVGAQRPEAHRRDVEERVRIGLLAVGPADDHAIVMAFRRTRCDRMIDPLVIAGVDVLLGSKRALVELTLGALIGDRAFGTVERRAVGLALEKILADLRADLLEKETDVGEDRIVALEAVIGLNHVPRANGGERDAEQRDRQKHLAEAVDLDKQVGQGEYNCTDRGRHDGGITHGFLPGSASIGAMVPGSRLKSSLQARSQAASSPSDGVSSVSITREPSSLPWAFINGLR
jgi:hypothetical protein